MALNWNTVPQLTPALKRLGMDFNGRFPRRDSGSDGAWGDAAHKLSPSGHNPDDTVGSLSESEDADWVPEIRAIDVDADLGEPGVTMQQVVDRVIGTPGDRARLSYVIYNYRIAGDFNGWRWGPYSGSNPHDHHVHFSGKASQDAANAPFTSVLNFNTTSSGDDDMSDQANNILNWAGKKSGTGGLPYVPEKGSPFRDLEHLRRLETIEAELKALKATLAEVLTAVRAR